jgi:hypothetical protein
MSDDQNGAAAPDLFTKMWSDFTAQMMRAGMAFTPNRTPSDMTQEMRSAMFKAWGEYLDQFMRSPDFLEAMQRSLGTSLKARKQWNDFMGQMQHGLQIATRQDVDQILSSLHHAERRIIDRIEELTEQMEALEGKLEASEKGKNKSGGKKKKNEAD